MQKSDATPRRKDRMVTDDLWIKEVLAYELFCTVSTVEGDQPFLRPSAYYFSAADHAVYIHGAHSGRAIKNLNANPKICLSVFSVGAMRVHERAFDFLQEHAGVMVFGTASIVVDNAKKHEVMAGTFAKHAPHLTAGVDFQPASQAEIDETTIIKISIDKWSGKMKWTDEPERKRFRYEDVRKDVPAPYPWAKNSTTSAPLNMEWMHSTQDKS
ncbi:MAG: hypothetical protein GQ535_12040 [Rhodobacteraceae bacterium]|nr:hypothetical protein [Paracoccaceae bacterium]